MSYDATTKAEGITTIRGFVFYSVEYADVQELHLKCTKGKNDRNLLDNISYRLEIIEGFKKLIPDFPKWLLNQTEDGHLYERRLDFIKDIIKFIRAGSRKVSISNWPFLIDTDVKKSDNTEKRNVLKWLKDEGNKTPFPSTEDLIINWCSKSSGFEDMLWSLEFMTEIDYIPEPEPLNQNGFSFRLK